MKLLLVSTVYLAGPFLIILLFNRVRLLRKLGTILMAYCIGLVLSLLNFIPSTTLEHSTISTLQETIMNLAVPLAIPLMLFSSDFRLWSKTMKKTFSVLLGGIVSIVLAIVLGFFLFQNAGIVDLWKYCGIMAGLYTGGTLNLVAVGEGLSVDPTIYTLLSTFDMVLSFFFLLFIVGGGFRIFRWFLPFSEKSKHSNSVDLQNDFGFENYHGMLQKENLGKMVLGLLLSFVFLIVGAGLALLLTGRLNELVIILTITTLSIAASFVKKIRELPKTFELGMFLIILFSIVIASLFDLTKLHSEQWKLLAFVAYIILSTTAIHLFISRITKIPGDLFTVAHVALLYSPPFVPPVAAAMHNKKVLLSGLVIGLMGWAVGTYLGIGLAELLKLIPTA